MDVVQCPVLFNRRERGNVYRLGFAYDALKRGAIAAQFLMITTDGAAIQVMPRPFSLSDCYRDRSGNAVSEVLYKPIGNTTKRMARLREGEEIGIGGLCGRGFPMPAEGRKPVLLAGGIGNAPFAFHIRQLLEGPFANRPSEVTLILAGRSAQDLYIQDWVRETGVCVVEVTDDGSAGEKGRITDALLAHLPKLGPIEGFACGPEPMLHALSLLAIEKGFPCHLAVEERMACGYGVCNACVILERTQDAESKDAGYFRACIDGPVFESREICL
jgi:dihydroorotate dehydrogenase electron transfer subunit